MKTLLTFFFVCIVLNFSANATTYYVSPAPLGNNSNSGNNSAPFLTIAKGILAASNYDTVIVTSGIYDINTALTIHKPLTLLGQGAQINGSSWVVPASNKRLLIISNTNDVLVDGFVFKNLIGDFSIGVFITGSGRNITVSHCLVTNIGWTNSNLSAIPTGSNNANGIMVMGSSSVPLSQINIQHDTITNCTLGFSEALTVLGNVDTFSLSHNYIYANSNIGIDCAGSKNYTGAPPALNYARNGRIANNIVFRCMSPARVSAGIYLDGAYNCVVEGNIVYDNGVGISLGQESMVNSGAKSCSRNKVVNNVIYRNAVAGVFWGDTVPNNTKVVNNTFVNNTLFQNRTGAVINGVTAIHLLPAGTGPGQYGDLYGGEVHIQSCDSSLFENNILFPLSIRHCVVVPNSFIATNLLFNYNSFNRANINVSYFDIGNGASANGIAGIKTFYTQNETGLYMNTINGDPNFVDTANANFRLKTSPFSNCINAGNPLSNNGTVSVIDFDGNSRIYGARIDMGAFESQTILSVGENLTYNKRLSFDVTIYPNPGTGLFRFKASEQLISVMVCDVTGHIVFQNSNPIKHIDLTKLPAGIYQIRCFGISGSFVTKRLFKI